MTATQGYVLGQSERAARRLEVQDAHFADVSERLLDELELRPADRVVELGCGPGGFSRRVLRRLGAGGVLVGVDCTEGLLAQARTAHDRSRHARHQRQNAVFLGLCRLSRAVTQCDVAQFVGHYSCQFAFAAGCQNRPGINVHRPAGKGESIYLTIFHCPEIISELRMLKLFRDRGH